MLRETSASKSILHSSFLRLVLVLTVFNNQNMLSSVYSVLWPLLKQSNGTVQCPPVPVQFNV